MSGDSDIDPDAVERLQVLAGVREFPVRVKCATLAWHTMNTAFTNPEDGDNSITTE
jgi:nitrogen fixation NifU-like protein